MTWEERAGKLRGRRILVTGGTGFVGRHLVRRLEQAGIGFTGVTHRTSPPDSDSGHARWIPLDLTDPEAVDSCVESLQPEITFHLAGVLGADRTLEFAGRAVRSNFLASHHLLSALGRSGCARRIVLMGSSEEYGRQETLPLTEDLPPRPVSPYSASKAAVTQFALLYHELFGLPVVVLRPFVVYGPGQPGDMLIPALMQTLARGEIFRMTPGRQTRDFIHVDDVVNALIAASGGDGVEGEVFNVCSGEERSVGEVAEMVARLAGGAAGTLQVGALPYRENEVWRLVGSNDKARRVLDWSPQVRLEDGLRQTWDAYRKS